MDKNLIEALGKVIIAVAWADKDMAYEEINCLKDLLFEFQGTFSESGLTSMDGTMFDMYIDSPVDAAERDRLVNELKETVWSEEDKAFALSTLKSMVEADGKITDAEQSVLNGIIASIESIDTGTLGDLGRLIRGALQRRSDAVNHAPNREKYFEEFLKNKVYYEVRRRLDLGEANLEISDEDLRKLSMAGGLMARVAQTDKIVLTEEKDKMISILRENWHLTREAATFVVEVAMAEGGADFDYLRMSREFLEITQPAERASFLDILFAVANADNKISNAELKEIHHIAGYLLMSSNSVMEVHSKFIK